MNEKIKSKLQSKNELIKNKTYIKNDRNEINLNLERIIKFFLANPIYLRLAFESDCFHAYV